MANKKTSEPAQAPTYDPDVNYEVVLTRPVQLFGMQYRPLHEHTWTGAVVSQVIEENGADVIDSATPVQG